MKNSFLLVLIIFTTAFNSQGQINILDSIGKRNFDKIWLKETSSSIYIMRFIRPTTITTANQNKYAFELQKIAKNPYSLQTSTIAVGDTLAVDSFVATLNIFFIIDGNKIHFAFEKIILLDTSNLHRTMIRASICYKQLDTNLNVTIPERKVKTYDGTTRFENPDVRSLILVNSKPFISYLVYDTITSGSTYPMSMYLALDLSGNLVRNDTIPVKPRPYVYYHAFTNVNNYPGNRIMFSGDGLVKSNTNTGIEDGFVLTDTALNVIDTFGRMYGTRYNKPPISDGHFLGALPSTVVLPTGSVLGGSIFEYKKGGRYYQHAAIARYNCTNRFKMDTVLVSVAKDTFDIVHSLGMSIGTFAYNTADNLVYLATSSHLNNYQQCLASSNYTEVIAADTFLNLKWRKYIYSGAGFCGGVSYVTPCVGRSGVLISGQLTYLLSPNDSSQLNNFFLYRIDSSSSTGIKNPDNGMVIRDRFRIYPNPTTDAVMVDDFLQGMTSIGVYDMQGKMVYYNQAPKQIQEVSLGQQPPGTYLIRLSLKDGESYSQRVVRH
jgi:hypothetical protein